MRLLSRELDTRDIETGRHSQRVVELARRVGERMALGEEALVELECAGGLHDVGKIGVSDAILLKAGPLDPDEWAAMRSHPALGADMLSRVPGLEGVAAIVLHHHERFDGSGYPYGLAGEEIPLASRILSVCDAFEAMMADRPYRPGLSFEAALAELRAGSGSQFDPGVVEALREALEHEGWQALARAVQERVEGKKRVSGRRPEPVQSRVAS